MRNAIDAGDIPGPGLLAASPEMTVTSGLGDARLCTCTRVLRRRLRRTGRLSPLSPRDVPRGVDTLKINPSGDTLLPRARSAQTR